MYELAKATFYAEKLVSFLQPYCERIQIAGSIRRKKILVKDIEIVCIPKKVMVPSPNLELFGDSRVLGTHPKFVSIINQWDKVKGEPTGKYTQRVVPGEPGLMIDIFMADTDNWGMTLAIRTGSADFSHYKLAAEWNKKGYRSEDGLLRNRHNAIVPVREEIDLFKLLEIPFVEPHQRNYKHAEQVRA